MTRTTEPALPDDDVAAEHDLADLQRDGTSLVTPVEAAALQAEALATLGRSNGRVDDVLEVLRRRLSARAVILFHAVGDAPSVRATAGTLADLITAGPLGWLATRASRMRRGVLVQGQGKPGRAALSQGQTGVHGQWSAAAVPFEDSALLVVKLGKKRLDRCDLATLVLLAAAIRPALVNSRPVLGAT